jgi:hypothetical protein
LSATVIARDNTTANALATALCVLGSDDGLKLVKATDGAECLLVLADGKLVRSGGFGNYEKPVATSQPAAVWPNGNQLTISFTVEPQPTKPKLRPYVGIWIESSTGKPVRTIELWAQNKKVGYLHGMADWWHSLGTALKDPLKAVTRATRPPGKYSVSWDGTDADGKPVNTGIYRIVLEVAYEKGDDLSKGALVDCGKQADNAKIAATTTFKDVTITYGPPEKKVP